MVSPATMPVTGTANGFVAPPGPKAIRTVPEATVALAAVVEVKVPKVPNPATLAAAPIRTVGGEDLAAGAAEADLHEGLRLESVSSRGRPASVRSPTTLGRPPQGQRACSRKELLRGPAEPQGHLKTTDGGRPGPPPRGSR